jgi:hypothetical protein
MVEGEVTSRQDGGAHKWVKPEVDATAAGGGMTGSVVLGSYLLLRSANQAGRRPTCDEAYPVDKHVRRLAFVACHALYRDEVQ